jgi:signal transduction histidine kinase
MKTELITNVSHDIKTPLTSIINYVDLLEKENITGEPEASYIEVLARQSARLKKLIEDLVEASKASTGNVQVELTYMDINMLIDQATAEYVDKLADKNIQLVVSKSNQAAYAMADGRHLWRVFDNLLNNACKYAMPGTRVYVTTNVVDTQGNKISDINNIDVRNVYVKIEFKNISKEPLNISSDELMERFVRGDSSRNTEGSGLGLSISRSLCQLQSAYFDVSIDGDLYKAIITFPYAQQNNTAYSMIVADEEV